MSKLQHIWAKSAQPGEMTGELLTDHLAATLRSAARVRDRVGALAGVPQQFWSWVFLAALLHDAGKVADGFQAMVGNGPGPSRPWGQRHEVLSLGFAARLLHKLPDAERLWIALGIVTHHRPLTGASGHGLFGLYDQSSSSEFAATFGHIDQQATRELMCWLAATADRERLPLAAPGTMATAELTAAAHAVLQELRETWLVPVDRELGRTAVLVQGAVTLADHLSSARASLQAVQPVDADYAATLANRFDLREYQLRAATVDGHLLLRAPTGAGKTEAAQLWAARQTESLRALSGGQPRIFYTLPYLASINAMSDRLATGLGNAELVGIAHSRAALYHLDRSLRDDTPPARSGSAEEVATAAAATTRVSAAGKAVSRAAATRLFRELVRVGTPYQLLRGALAGPASSGILIDSAGSIFILDELHAYDTRRLGFILAMARFWEQLGGRIAVLSATLPRLLAALLDETLDRRLTLVEALDHPWPIRHRLAVRSDHLTSEASVREIEARLRASQAVLVAPNNIADARALFDRLAPVAIAHHGNAAAELLHSRFRAMDRADIETRIRSRYGTGGRREPGLVVATQVIEVSLDVDFDALHASGAPLEALIQRAGRVNRTGERAPADVVVHLPGYRARRGGKELYADGVYECEPARMAMEIITRNDGAMLSERDLAAWLDDVYDSPWGEQWRRAVTHWCRTFDMDFLSFTMPFDDRDYLSEQFDQLFDGTEAVLDADLTAYAGALNSASGKEGRLLGSQYLIPLPHYARPLGRYDRDLKVTVIGADYDARSGLGEIHDRGGNQYQAGEVL
jgi:CRISPR-associated helicase Cas3/CRISPR-associated endonuclease Cas3-HD